MTLREKFEELKEKVNMLDCDCDADHREAVRAEYLHRYGTEAPSLTLEEVLGGCCG
jgi:hypothetical protein